MNLKQYLKKVKIRASKIIAVSLVTTMTLNLGITIPVSASTGSVDEMAWESSRAAAKQIEAEGIVLLENDDNTLPLTEKKVNVFGSGSIEPFFGGGGSGAITVDNDEHLIDFYEGLTLAGIEYNKELYNIYDYWYNKEPIKAVKVETGGNPWAPTKTETLLYDLTTGLYTVEYRNNTVSKVIETGTGNVVMNMEANTFTDPKTGQLVSVSAQANTTISVVTGNSSDEAFMGTGGAAGQFGSNPTRAEMPVSKITEELVTNGKNFSDTAIIVISRCGTESADLTESILALSETERQMVDKVATSFDKVIVLFNIDNIMEMGWIEDYSSIKAAAIIWAPGEVGMQSVGEMLTGTVNPSGRLADTISYDTAAHPSNENFGSFQYEGINDGRYFIEYEEGIYVGYRYFETFFPEGVQYPFGYGLSYTDFSWNVKDINVNAELVTATVEVENIGNVPGKEVVQAYFSAPYTEGGIEKSAIELAGYKKTKLLEAGEKQEVIVTFATADMASYSMDLGAWVLEAGDYEISISQNIRNKVGSANYTVASDVVYKADDATGANIENRFDTADDQYDTVLSRAGVVSGAAIVVSGSAITSYPTAPINREASAAVKASDALPAPVTVGTAPVFGVTLDTTITLQDVNKVINNPSSTSMEIDQTWADFLSQLTLDESINLIANCGFKTPGISRLLIPATVDNDGPAAVKGPGGSSYVNSGIAYPIATALACTWNDTLAELMGISCGIEAADMGTNVWYAPGMNIHRSPRSGRNFEYYSEDPLLSGKMAAALTKGAQSQGLVVTLKHFAVNDQEEHRDSNGLYTWVNEQALREIYLEPFEIAVKEANALGVMSAFNRIGTDWAGGSKALLTDILRTEWGFKGFVVTDYYLNFTGAGYMSPVLAVYAQNDAFLTGMYSFQATPIINAMKNALAADPIGFGTAMQACIKNICTMKMATLAFEPVKEGQITGDFKMLIGEFDWGPAVPKIILHLNKEINAEDINKNVFTVVVEKQGIMGTETGTRTITAAYASDAEGNLVSTSTSSYVTIEMSVHPSDSLSSPFTYEIDWATFKGLNDWSDPYNYTITSRALNLNITQFTGKVAPLLDQFTKDAYTKEGITLQYASYTPKQDTKKNPLVIWLHGAGEGGTDPDIALLGNKVVNLATDQIQNIFQGAYILTPQTPTMWMDNGSDSYTQDGTSMYTSTLKGLIDTYVAGNSDIDTSRIYIGGCSNGGFMTMNMIINYPDFFAAAYPVCEAYKDSWITDDQIKAIKNIPIWFTQAANDTTVAPVLNVIPTYERLIAAGAGNVHLSYFTDVHDTTENYLGTNGNAYQYDGHWSWIYTLNNECTKDYDGTNVKVNGKDVTIMEWLSEQVKNAGNGGNDGGNNGGNDGGNNGGNNSGNKPDNNSDTSSETNVPLDTPDVTVKIDSTVTKVTLSTSDLLDAMEKAENKTLDIEIVIPKDSKVASIILPKEVLSKAMKEKIHIHIKLVDQTDKIIARWSFDGSLLAKETVLKDINIFAGVNILKNELTTNKDLNKIITKQQNAGVYLSLKQKGKYPLQGDLTVNIPQGKPGQRVFIYKVNKTTMKLETIYDAYSYKLDKNGNLTFGVIEGGDYVVLTKKADSKQITALKNQIKVAPTKKIITTKQSMSIKVTLPSYLQKTQKLTDKTAFKAIGAVTITHKVSDKKLATVNKDGKVTAKAAGKVTITTTIKLSNGTSRIVQTKLTIK